MTGRPGGGGASEAVFGVVERSDGYWLTGSAAFHASQAAPH